MKLYDQFQDEIAKIQAEENNKQIVKEAKKKRIKSDLSDTEENDAERLDTMGSIRIPKPSDQPVKIIKMDGFRPEGYVPPIPSVT